MFLLKLMQHFMLLQATTEAMVVVSQDTSSMIRNTVTFLTHLNYLRHFGPLYSLTLYYYFVFVTVKKTPAN